MKNLNLVIFLFFCTIGAFAQTPKAIEADLLKSFKKIDYLSQDNTNANDAFAKKLMYYTQKYPATINQKFASLTAEHLDISTADDGAFRIYSWDTWGGGTMHFFESVFQYKIEKGTLAILDTPKGEGDSRPNYTRLYTFKANGQTYYLGVYLTIGSTKDAGQGIQIFSINNGKLIDDIKLIKTASGLHSQLYYYYNFFSVVDWKVRPIIYFDPINQTINMPLVASGGEVTHKYITYKFNGKYFEKIKP